VEQELVTLPAEARAALAGVLEQLAADPWAGSPYDPRWSPEFRTMPFGGAGLAAYVISERRRSIVVEHITWTQ
jgi:hypothetical protein